jgi:hypothetical protein
VTQYGTSTAFSCTAKKWRTHLFTKSRSDVRSREQRLSKSLGFGPRSRIIGTKSLFTLKKKQGRSRRIFFPRKPVNCTQLGSPVSYEHCRTPVNIKETMFKLEGKEMVGKIK